MYTVPKIVSSGPYATLSQILAFVTNIYPQFPPTGIPSYILQSTTEMIENRTQSWSVFAGSIFLTGRDEASIQCPITPINSLTGVNLYAMDGTYVPLLLVNPQGGVIGGQEAEIVWDPQSGKIRRVNDVKFVVDINSLDESPVFPESDGEDNIELIGNFGIGPYQQLTLLQCLLATQALRFQFPALGIIDGESEKIGDYAYKLNFMERTQNLKNQRLTLDGYIEHLFDLLPKDYGDNYGAI